MWQHGFASACREGDASEALSTNGLRVLASSAESPELVQDLTFSSAV